MERFSVKAKAVVGGLSSKPLLVVGLLLSAFGLLMIYSSSAVMGLQKYGDSLYYVKKQFLFLGLGWLLYFVVAQLPLERFARYRMILLAGGMGLLILVMIPGIGSTGGGAQRWLDLGFLRFQPSEIVRLLLVFYLAGTLVAKSDKLHLFNKGFLPLLIVTGLLMGLLLLQPDFGGAMNVLALSLVLWFVGGIPMAYLLGLGILILPAVAVVVMNEAYRAKRVLTFLDPFQDVQGAGFQVIQSFMAFLNGGWTGVGIGNSQQKLYYLPEAHTDFIFSVLGEELGVVGIAVVTALFLGLLFMGLRIAKNQREDFGYFLGIGLTFFLVVPALLNMMVTMGLLPTKGLPLPFFSSGGSAFLSALIALGALQALHRRAQFKS